MDSVPPIAARLRARLFPVVAVAGRLLVVVVAAAALRLCVFFSLASSVETLFDAPLLYKFTLRTRLFAGTCSFIKSRILSMPTGLRFKFDVNR